MIWVRPSDPRLALPAVLLGLGTAAPSLVNNTIVLPHVHTCVCLPYEVSCVCSAYSSDVCHASCCTAGIGSLMCACRCGCACVTCSTVHCSRLLTTAEVCGFGAIRQHLVICCRRASPGFVALLVQSARCTCTAHVQCTAQRVGEASGEGKRRWLACMFECSDCGP